MTATVRDILGLMETIAPSHLAEDWDNTGLQVGNPDWPVKTVWIALDPLPDVIRSACDSSVDLLITHHPLLFRPQKTIDFSNSVGHSVYLAARHHLSIFAAHTNLDSAGGGVNDVLAKKIGLQDTTPLHPAPESMCCKLVVFVPPSHESSVRGALYASAAGRIGNYSCCTFSSPGKGTYRPEEGSNPFSGRVGDVSEAEELRIETVVPEKDVEKIVDHLKTVHPYETMAYDVYPLASGKSTTGLGRIGRLNRPIRLDELASSLKRQMQLSALRFAGRPDLSVQRVAICSGSGSSLLGNFFKSDADVFITGDVRYHDARTVEEQDRGIIDIGHFGSEFVIVDALTNELSRKARHQGLQITIAACEVEKEPLRVV